MAKQQDTINYNQLFMIFVFIIGIVLFSISWSVDEKLQTTSCTSKPLKTSNKLVLCIGTILIAFSLSFFGCSTYCEKTFDSGPSLLMHVAGIFVLGILLTVLGGIINANSIDNCSNSASSSTIWVLGVLLTIISVLYFYMKFKNVKRN